MRKLVLDFNECVKIYVEDAAFFKFRRIDRLVLLADFNPFVKIYHELTQCCIQKRKNREEKKYFFCCSMKCFIFARINKLFGEKIA